MREKRVIATIAVLMILFVTGCFIWYTASKKSGPLDEQAVRRIERICGFQAECKVQLGDLFGGDWDTFYEFGVAVDQPTINGALGVRGIQRAERMRTMVLMDGSRVMATEHERYGMKQPLDGQIEFVGEHHRDDGWVRYKRDTWLRARAFHIVSPTEEGTYYVLSEEEPVR